MASIIVGMGFLIGVTLGTRYKVLVLVPTIIVGASGAAVAGIGFGYQFWSLVLVIILTCTAIQLGYLIGMMAHALVLHRNALAEGGIPPAKVARHKAVAALSDGDAVTTAPSATTAETAPAVSPTDHCPLDDVGRAEADILDAEHVALVPGPDVQRPDHNSPMRARRIARRFLTLIVSRDGSDR
jgi:hypothetical protein